MRSRPGLAIVLSLLVVCACSGPVASIGSVAPTAASPGPIGPPSASSPSVVPTSLPDPSASALPDPSVAPPSLPVATSPGTQPGSSHPTIAQTIGQKLVVTMAGRKPSAGILGRVRRGEIGGVVLIGTNITTKAALVSLTGKLQVAATAGGQPPLLIAVDQEGGSLKRVPWIPPTLTVPQMGAMNSTSVARSQGRKTGAALLALGINVDFAPVADIPRSTASFMYQQGRTFGFNAARTARLADAFAGGLAAAGVLATMKHFPGIGLAKKNSDHYVDTVKASETTLATDLGPYRTAIGHDIPMIMLSNVTYTAYDSANAAGWSAAIAGTLLRDNLGFTGVTITDSLNGTAHARGLTVKQLAFRASVAGTDLILVTSGEASSAHLYNSLLQEATDGSIPAAALQASYSRIVAMKAGL